MLAPQVPTAQGRFLVSNPMTIPSKVAHDALAKAFPEYQFPAGKDEPSKVVIDNSKVRAALSTSFVPASLVESLQPPTSFASLMVNRLRFLASWPVRSVQAL